MYKTKQRNMGPCEEIPKRTTLITRLEALHSKITKNHTTASILIRPSDFFLEPNQFSIVTRNKRKHISYLGMKPKQTSFCLLNMWFCQNKFKSNCLLVWNKKIFSPKVWSEICKQLKFVHFLVCKEKYLLLFRTSK
jgi:hypothetical protein